MGGDAENAGGGVKQSSREATSHPSSNAATLAAELRSVGAILDVRGGAGDEGDEIEPAGGVGGILLTAIVILGGIAAIAWWYLR